MIEKKIVINKAVWLEKIFFPNKKESNTQLFHWMAAEIDLKYDGK